MTETTVITKEVRAAKELAAEAMTRTFIFLHAALQERAATAAKRVSAKRDADRLLCQLECIGEQLMNEAHGRHNVYPLHGHASRTARSLGLHPGRHMDEQRQRLYDMGEALSTAAHDAFNEVMKHRRTGE